jgi:hypothetical protein
MVIWTTLFIFVAFPNVFDQVERSHNADLIAAAHNFRTYNHPTVTFTSDISCHRSSVSVHPVRSWVSRKPASSVHPSHMQVWVKLWVRTQTESRHVHMVHLKFVCAPILVSSLTLKPVWGKWRGECVVHSGCWFLSYSLFPHLILLSGLMLQAVLELHLVITLVTSCGSLRSIVCD